VDTKINLFLIGAAKSGTTSLHRYLQSNPQIFMADYFNDEDAPNSEKGEIDYFSSDEKFSKGESYLDAYLKRHNGERVVGLSDVNLLYVPNCPLRLHQYNSDAKIVAVLRNPVDRAYSAFWFARRNGVEQSETFEEALNKEASNEDSAFARRNLAYLEHGHYAEQLERFFRLFPDDQIRVLLLEDLRCEDKWQELLRWLRVEKLALPAHHNYNRAMTPRNFRLQQILRNPDTAFSRLYKGLMPRAIRHLVTKHATNRIVAWNLVPFEYPPMNGDTRTHLREHFAPHNNALSNLIDRDLSHWR
jgi:hypothetical protein